MSLALVFEKLLYRTFMTCLLFKTSVNKDEQQRNGLFQLFDVLFTD